MGKWHSIFFTLLGDPRRIRLEDRLLNAICLLNGLSNLGGIPQALTLPSASVLVPLYAVTGLAFLALYIWSRKHRGSSWLAGLAIVLIGTFLAINTYFNSGSLGGAHYYWIPALVIGVIVMRTPTQKTIALFGFLALTLGMYWLEHQSGIASPPATWAPTAQWWDRTLNFLFVQVFTGCLVWILATNLTEERRRAENLLLNILPVPVAQELKQNDEVVPRHYSETTVLFTDFVGFTEYAESMSPQQLVKELDECFREFDRIVANHNLEKIKTIGDAYMAVAGVPDSLSNHAHAAIKAALEIREYIKNRATMRSKEGLPSWTVRIGLHSGPLVAGVIGRHKFIYDVWGDTVNTASRMESAGLPGEINISQPTYDRVQASFSCESRGKIAAKGKGDLGMYRVQGVARSESA